MIMSKEAPKHETKFQEPRFIVNGKFDPNIDVPAVQSAIDAAPEDGRTVYLNGRFSFGTSSVTIRNWARIRGSDEFGKKAEIEGGHNPFTVDSGQQFVSITGVHFINPIQSAIRVTSVNGLSISDCEIDTPVLVPAPATPPFNTGGGIVGVSKVGTVVKEIAGNISILRNVMDITSQQTINTDPTARTFGINFDLADQSMQANLTISGNTIKNVTAHGMILRDIVGTATINGQNAITTGTHGARITGGDSFVDGIMCQGAGTYTVSDNVIDCGYENSAGIRLISRGTSTAPPLTGTTVTGNSITMSKPSTASNGSESAAIELRRRCGILPDPNTNTVSNTVSNNTIMGEAGAALSLIAESNQQGSFIPKHNTFVNNDHRGFTSTLTADIFVAPNVEDTNIQSVTGGTICSNLSVRTSFPQNYVEVC